MNPVFRICTPIGVHMRKTGFISSEKLSLAKFTLQLHCRDVFVLGALPHRAELRWVFQLIISCGCTCLVAEISKSTRLSGTTFEMQRSIEELLCFSLPWCGLVPTNSHFGPWILRFQHLSRQKLPGQWNVNSWDLEEEVLVRIE